MRSSLQGTLALWSMPEGKRKESTCLYVLSGEGNGNPLQYSSLENAMDGEAWKATVHRITKSWTQLSDFTFLFLMASGKDYSQPLHACLIRSLTLRPQLLQLANRHLSQKDQAPGSVSMKTHEYLIQVGKWQTAQCHQSSQQGITDNVAENWEVLILSVKELRLDSGWLLKEGALACLPFRRFIFLLALVWRVVWRRGSIHRQRDIGIEKRRRT